MSSRTEVLHQHLLAALGSDTVVVSSSLRNKPLLVDLRHPFPARLRIYIYSLVGGAGEARRREYKAVLRVPGQAANGYGSFDHSDGRFTLLTAYSLPLNVFVIWDASLHSEFKSGTNVQVRDETVITALGRGYAEQVRRLTKGVSELVIACRPERFDEALIQRIATTGGVSEAQWAISPN